MFERKHEAVASNAEFRKRLIKFIIIDFFILVFSLSLGILGYHILGGLGWTDSFMNASMILGGMGPVDTLTSKAAKIFAGCYALFSGIAFLSAFALLSAPIYHRFLHKFHIEEEG
jgi:hypothetical protein